MLQKAYCFVNFSCQANSYIFPIPKLNFRISEGLTLHPSIHKIFSSK